MPDIAVTVDDASIDLAFDAEWLTANPLTVADLDREIGYAQEIGYTLTFS